MPLSALEQQRLQSFREAAAKVRKASIIAKGKDIEIRFRPGEPGYMDIFVRLLEEEPFHSLALAIRLVYLTGEPAFFFYICNLLAREDSGEVRLRVAEIRGGFQAALTASENSIHLDDGEEPSVLSGQEVFEHWLHGIAFHQDEERRPTVERLVAEGPHFIWRVQAIALQLAGRILDLDDVVADFLGEAQLPRIAPGAS